VIEAGELELLGPDGLASRAGTMAEAMVIVPLGLVSDDFIAAAVGASVPSYGKGCGGLSAAMASFDVHVCRLV
jgi:hypothetical protein